MAESDKVSVLRRWLGRLGGGTQQTDSERRVVLGGAGSGSWNWTGGRAFRPDNDNIVFDVTAFAARLAGRDGWVVEQAVLSPEEIERRLGGEAGVIDIVILGRGRGQGRDKRGFARPHRPASYTAVSQGWTFDLTAGSWRAPDEPLATLPWPAVPVEALVMMLGRPAWGWLPVALAAGEETVAFKADCGACPFPPMVAWLEAIAAGGELEGGIGRFAGRHGATHVEFLAFPTAAAERVRVAISLDDDGAVHERRIALDIDIGRRALVFALYGGLRAYAAGPDFRPFAWAHVDLADELARHAPDITTNDLATLDAAGLERLARQLGERAGTPGDGEGVGDLPDVPVAWDGWDTAQRHAWLPRLLGANLGRWIGTDLRPLRSVALERFLELSA